MTKRKLHSILILLLLAVLILALGIPHEEGRWFEWVTAKGEKADMHYILVTEFRLPRIAMALVVGVALSISGLLLQTLFNNPLAGPSILGLTSGAHLFVALAVLGTSLLPPVVRNLSVTAAATGGSLVFGLLILLLASRVKSQISLLLIGMMLGTFVSAVTDILLSSADPNALKAFTMWSFGSLEQANFSQLPAILICAALGYGAAFLMTKPLNALVLGERQAGVLGVNIRATQWKILVVVSFLTGLVTALCGPIAFVGLIVPNLVKIFYKTSSHSQLLIGSALVGAIFMLVCDMLIISLNDILVLPINSLTSIVGAPIVVALLLKKVRHA